MNIISQLCGLVVLLYLFIFNSKNKHVGFDSERSFRILIEITLVSLSLDILSVVLISNSQTLPIAPILAVAKMYLGSLILICFASLHYVLVDIFDRNEVRKSRLFYLPIAIVGVIAVYVAPIYVYHKGSVVYSYGLSTLLTYAWCFFFLLAIGFYLINHGRKMTRGRVGVMMWWIMAWIVAALVQFIFNELLLVGFASSVGVMIIYLSLENPDSFLETRLNCFNSRALPLYLRQCYRNRISKSAIYISMVSEQTTKDDFKRSYGILEEMVSFASRYPGTKIFKNVQQELLVLFDDAKIMDQAFQEMKMHFDERASSLGVESPLYILQEDIGVAGSMEEELDVFYHVRREMLRDRAATVAFIDSSLIQELHNTYDIRREIKEAMEEDRVEVYYQPIYSVGHKQFTAAEALVRIKKRDGSILPPGIFIPEAENSGQIKQLGEIVFKKVCDLLKTGRLQELGVRYTEVNLSIIQCEQENLADTYGSIMDENGIDPGLINLEITETASINTRKVLLKNMERLMEKGVSFSLDDFGNGASNLNYFIDMPVSLLKIDRDMTNAYFDNKKAELAVKATIFMVHSMGLKLVVEGVETAEQLQEMERQGVDYIQGYYFSKPLPEKEYIEFLERSLEKSDDEGEHK